MYHGVKDVSCNLIRTFIYMYNVFMSTKLFWFPHRLYLFSRLTTFFHLVVFLKLLQSPLGRQRRMHKTGEAWRKFKDFGTKNLCFLTSPDLCIHNVPPSPFSFPPSKHLSSCASCYFCDGQRIAGQAGSRLAAGVTTNCPEAVGSTAWTSEALGILSYFSFFFFTQALTSCSRLCYSRWA